ncbi:SRPBCC family protein [Rhodococcus rhodochrous]|uniref:SRPBCC family protein n=1 Tax=Rhodococcus rhodochrous TaxID=1829 RepID=UPI000381BDC3|nr:SRPBCC family protein [Rhodococcus rhodochrous]
MSEITQSVDVAVPVSVAYNQWTQFERLPQFMDGVDAVEQLDETHLRWTIRIGMTARTFTATITEQHPDQRIAWRSDGTVRHAGIITFHRLDDTHCRVTARMDIDPVTVTETVADKTGILARRIAKDLERFKDCVEARGSTSGAWRGEVDPPDSGPSAHRGPR